jgi:hypothetical protein
MAVMSEHHGLPHPDGDDAAPLGFPVLAEVPELAQVLEQLQTVDRLLAQAVEGLIRLQDTSLSETATGVPVEQWLAIVARRTRCDRRMLALAATTCRRLPTVRAAFSAGSISWAQLRAVALKVDRLPRHLDDAADAALAGALAETADADPDALGRAVDWLLGSLDPDPGPDPEGAGPDEDVLVLQPRLDGAGGRLFGDFTAAGFAILDSALNTGLHPDGPTRTSLGADPDPDRCLTVGRQLGRQRAARLLDLCTRDGDSGGTSRPVGVLARVELTTLLGMADRHADLLTHLAGGAMHVDADTARTLADTFGTRLRLIVHHEGRTLGVGRARRHPPGWLTDAVLALHDTCTEPGCTTPARRCPIDHARPWHDGGRTDHDNLAPLCVTANRTKEPDGWHCNQTPDGTRTWYHPRTGLTTRTIPTTSRPPLPARGDATTRAGPTRDGPTTRDGPARDGPTREGPPRDGSDDLPF